VGDTVAVVIMAMVTATGILVTETGAATGTMTAGMGGNMTGKTMTAGTTMVMAVAMEKEGGKL